MSAPMYLVGWYAHAAIEDARCSRSFELADDDEALAHLTGSALGYSFRAAELAYDLAWEHARERAARKEGNAT